MAARCRSQIPRIVAERFVSLAAFFISKTAGYAEQGRIFSD
jgi:hypothetical protein